MKRDNNTYKYNIYEYNIYTNNKKNNKGLSLIEIMVAIAIGSIVLASVTMLIVQGVKSYRTQTTMASLQNDANIALNQMCDNIMEGTCFTAYNKDVSGNLYTSYFKIKDNVYYVYEPDEKVLYQSQVPYKDGSSSVLCENVESFLIQILDYSLVEANGKIQAIANPLQLKAYIKVAKLGESREAARTISMRNDMSEIKLMVQKTGETGEIKKLEENVIGYDIKSLKNYITSDN